MPKTSTTRCASPTACIKAWPTRSRSQQLARASPALPELQFAGEPAFATDEVYFYGISQGHILGGTYASLSPDIPRFVLGVGGANFSLIMFRSRAFLAFRLLIDTNIPEQVDRQTFNSQLQLILDRIDPLTYAPHVLADPYPGAEPRQIMLQVGSRRRRGEHVGRTAARPDGWASRASNRLRARLR